MTAHHFVVTAADGRQDVFAKVENPKGFMAAMIGSGKKVHPASAAELAAAGVTARLASSGRSGTAGLIVGRMQAAASSAPAPRPVAAAPTASVRRAAPRPPLSLADMVRKEHGLPLSAEGQATMAAKVTADKGLKVDIVANMKRRCGVKD